MKKHIAAQGEYIFLRKSYLAFGYALAALSILFLTIGAIAFSYAAINIYGTKAVVLAVVAGGVLLFFLLSFTLYRFVHNMLARMKTAEEIVEVLKKSKERYALAVSGASEGLWDFDLKTGTAYFSAYWKQILGYSDLDNANTIEFWKENIHPDDRSMVQEAMKEHLEHETPYYSAEYRIAARGGTYKWFFDKGRAIWDSNGKAVRIVGSSRDISNLKKVETVLQSRTEELEEAKRKIEEEVNNVRKFQQAVESSTDAITIMTPAGSIIYANTAWEKLTGYTYKNVQGENFMRWYEKYSDQDLLKDIKKTIKHSGQFSTEDIIGVRKDGTQFHAELSLFPIMRNGRAIFYTAIQQDITKRKEVDKAKTEFVSLASHQLRTPLSAIRWYAEMLLSGSMGKLDKSQSKYLQEIYTANRRMIDLVGALLNVSRIDLGTFGINPEQTDVRKLFDGVIQELAPLISEKKLHIKKEYPARLTDIFVDPQLMRNVFQNLLSNAIKYTPAGGHITIGFKQHSDTIEFSVADDGYGIPENQQNKIFTKLFRADTAREVDPNGTGLGLYIVKAIMEKSGGSIRFESREGAGTVFYGIIPIKGPGPKAGLDLVHRVAKH